MKHLRRSLYLSPKFAGESEINAFRRTHDPLAQKIPPHITLVFPFESSLNDQKLNAHATEATSTFSGFYITLGQPQIHEDYLWLPIVEGRDEVLALHRALYHGVLSSHLVDRPYEPHLTVARLDSNNLQLLHVAASALRGPFRGYVDRLFIESILQDQSSCVVSVIELHNRTAEQDAAANP